MDLDTTIWNSFDEHDRDLATSGLCGTFALALKEAVPGVQLALICLADHDGKPKYASDSEPYWRHVVAKFDGDLYDIDGRVKFDDVVVNYCWGNPYGEGGAMVPITVEELRALLTSDNSFDERALKRWTSTLSDAIETRKAPSYV